QAMTLMDAAIEGAAQQIFGKAVTAANVQPDGLGTTYHESGTLRMGDDPAHAVVNADGQFHYVTNLFAGDASVLPTCGSANPVMNGIGLQRRLAKRLVPEGDGIGNVNAPSRPLRPLANIAMPAAPPAPGTVLTLFDGTTLRNWRMAGRGTFHVIDGALQSVPGFDLGLLWCTVPMPKSYRLELRVFTPTFQNHSWGFVRFCCSPIPRPLNPRLVGRLDAGSAGQTRGVRNSDRQHRFAGWAAQTPHRRCVCRQLSERLTPRPTGAASSSWRFREPTERAGVGMESIPN